MRATSTSFKYTSLLVGGMLLRNLSLLAMDMRDGKRSPMSVMVFCAVVPLMNFSSSQDSFGYLELFATPKLDPERNCARCFCFGICITSHLNCERRKLGTFQRPLL